jgi:O-antigen ligase
MGFSETRRFALPVLLGLFGLFTPFSIAGAHISLGLAGLVAILDPGIRREVASLARHRLAWPFAAWILASLLSVVFAVDPAGSAVKLKKLALIPLVPLAALPLVRDRLRPILAALIASTAFVSIWGLVIFVARGGGLWARLDGISGFYMTVAGILMCVGLLVVAQLDVAIKVPQPRRLTFLGLAGLFIVLALAATYTRGSWLGFAAGLVWLFRRRWTLLAGIAVVAALFVALGPAGPRDRVLSTFDPGHERNVERVAIWQHGLDLVADYPLTGVGLQIPDSLMDTRIDTPYGPIRPHSHMHNAYLQIAVSMGVPALIVFVWLVVALFRMGLRAPRGGLRNLWEEGLVRAYPAILVALLVNGLVEWNFGDSEILGLLWFLTGCTMGIEAEAES